MPDDAHWMTEALKRADLALSEGEFPVGCVIVHEGLIVAEGRREGSGKEIPSEITHAEIKALRKLEAVLPLEERKKATLYATMEPCLMCYATLLLSGVGRVVWAFEDAMGGGTACDLDALPPLYRTRKPDIRAHVLRKESLLRFFRFSTPPETATGRTASLPTTP